ncbi:MAG: YihY/virulence factor BrkB family protein [Coleofasciculus sp. S288]|nr:YihY/virulence factor BrkB family protein [Coleofasciculus sp. S288]
MVNFKEIWKLLKETISEWQFNQVSLLASSLAYYTVFSLAPLVIIVIMIVGAIFGEAAAKGEIVGRIQGVVGEQGAQVIETAIANLREDTTGGTFRLIFSLAFLIFGASGVFAQIQNALDKIWEVKPQPGLHLLHFIRKRLLSFAMVLVIAFLLLVSLVVNTALAALVNFLSEFLPGLGYLWQFLSFFVSLGMVTLLFAAIYAILPDAQVAWRDAFVGAMITAVLFMLGQFLFGLFLSQTEFGSAYGVAGSFVIIITWIYYAAHILFLGAEFTKVYARRHGSPIVPEEYAVSISPNEETRSLASNQNLEKESQRDRSGKRLSSRFTNHQQQRNSGNLLTNLKRRCTWIFQRASGRRNRRR